MVIQFQQRRAQQRSIARRAILDATEALLLEQGYEGFSMRRLAERCGYTAPTIYHYFGDKTGLIDALLEERFAVILARLRRVRRNDNAIEDLRSLAGAFVQFALRNPTHYRLLSLPRHGNPPRPPSAEAALALVQAPLRELASRGRLRTRDVEAAFQALWSTLHGVVSLRSARPDYPWAPGLQQLAIDATLRGLVRERLGP